MGNLYWGTAFHRCKPWEQSGNNCLNIKLNIADNLIINCIVRVQAQKLGLPTRDAYLEMFEGDTDSAIQHLAVLFHLRNDQVKRTEYMKRLPVEKFNEVMDIIFSIS